MHKRPTKSSESITLRIEGRVISKKNSRRVFIRGGKLQNIPSKAYLDFYKRTEFQIPVNIKITPPYEAHYLFEMKGKLDSDIDNMIASINDVLEGRGIIEDDKLIKEIRATKETGKKDFVTHVWVKKLKVT